MQNLEIFQNRIAYLLNIGNELSKSESLLSRDSYYLKVFAEFRSGGLSFIRDLYGTAHSHFTDFDTKCTYSNSVCLAAGRGILNSIKSELDYGWLNTVKGIVSAELFTDFLDMATHLLDEGYKDPAAVMIGSVLEEHLRQLCQKNSIDTHILKNGDSVPKKADLINADLAKASVYNALDQKQITAWLDLRNKAAHGKYAEYSKEQVDLMLQGVMSFMTRVSVA